MGLPDLEILERQLGRKIENLRRVVRRCSKGFPVVIESRPVRDSKPFPTLFWLTCPHLRREVSRLEEAGWIKRFEEEIEKDGNFRERLFKAHVEVIRRRERLIEDGWIKEELSKVGSGGIRDFTKVKCLHLHLADYLAGIENPIGERVFQMIENKECEKIPSECSISTDSLPEDENGQNYERENRIQSQSFRNVS